MTLNHASGARVTIILLLRELSGHVRDYVRDHDGDDDHFHGHDHDHGRDAYDLIHFHAYADPLEV